MAEGLTVRAVDRALNILNCFAQGRESFMLTELANKIGLSPSTTLRILNTLEGQNYVYRSELGRYYLGFKLVQISSIAFSNLDVVRVGHPALVELANKFGESTGIYVGKGDYRTCVDRVEGTRSLRSVVQVGSSAPLTRGAAGRLLLTALPKADRERLMAADRAVSQRDLDEILERGYAVSYGEREMGVVSVAAPIYNATRHITAVVFITGPELRMGESLVAEMIPHVVHAAHTISRQMGFVEDDG